MGAFRQAENIRSVIVRIVNRPHVCNMINYNLFRVVLQVDFAQITVVPGVVNWVKDLSPRLLWFRYLKYKTTFSCLWKIEIITAVVYVANMSTARVEFELARKQMIAAELHAMMHAAASLTDGSHSSDSLTEAISPYAEYTTSTDCKISEPTARIHQHVTQTITTAKLRIRIYRSRRAPKLKSFCILRVQNRTAYGYSAARFAFVEKNYFGLLTPTTVTCCWQFAKAVSIEFWKLNCGNHWNNAKPKPITLT